MSAKGRSRGGGSRPAKGARSSQAANSGASPRPLLVYMQGVLGSLNPTERLIADYIVKDPERVLYHTISEMKQQTGASVGSIVGFCRTLGVGGFGDLKIALAREMAGGQFGEPAGDPQDDSVFEQVFRLHAKSLAETRQINSDETMLQAAAALAKAHRIHLFSTGLSQPVAYTAYCKFRLIGLSAYCDSDTHMQLIAATQMAKGDVAVGISCSGCTQETVQCMQVARERRATTICLTNSMRSPITGFADIVLHATPSEIKYFQAPLASRVTQLAVLDALFVSIALSHKSETMSHLHRIGEKLLERRAIIEEKR
ncbi:MAG: MurR/RpiR family transcriptional regulator [Acidobacteria bacterium]|nr:MurR/RpiR family transcriptional regulator [Acidobacteriota bacterium]